MSAHLNTALTNRRNTKLLPKLDKEHLAKSGKQNVQ
ncbi:unnamed protein product [Oikopleura dioica]|uniref:Uncharacterized protein n=1 Tax=Oikopleura dioica TaxID=34765 RepID=E4Z6R3_OIKDI|nr:unnamed protein product [Oikopleura dioica]